MFDMQCDIMCILKWPAVRRHSSPSQVKHVAATWLSSTSFWSTSVTVLESALQKSLVWSCRSACLGHPICHISHPLISAYGDRRRTWSLRRNCKHLMVHHEPCCCHAEQSWKYTESKKWCFKMNSFVHNQCRSFWTVSHLNMYILSQWILNMSKIQLLLQLVHTRFPSKLITTLHLFSFFHKGNGHLFSHARSVVQQELSQGLHGGSQWICMVINDVRVHVGIMGN